MKTLAERMQWARTELGLTQAELARKAGVSQSAIGNLESGLRQTSRNIVQIATALNVDPKWLAEGKGKPRKGESSIPGARPVVAFDDNEEIDPNYVLIRKVTLRLSAGIAGFTVEPLEENGAPIVFRKSWLESRGYKADKLQAIPVYGSSMEPGLHPGDTVVVNTADTEPKDGGVFAINYEGEPIIKRLFRDSGVWWLCSDNPDQIRFPRKQCLGDGCLIVGRVVHKQSEVV